MAFTQQTFFGASIRSFNASLGWGNQSSVLTVDLVEDDRNGDFFTPPAIGTAASFSYSGWTFQGIVQNWLRKGDTEGNPLWSVTLTDPRDILEGVQIILSGYNGSTFGVPNLINAFGYLENLNGFGGAEVNEGGMPWTNIRTAIQAITSGAAGQYGGPISFRGMQYQINLSALPNLPAYYRVGGQSISLLEFIADICSAGACDFFVTLLGNVITVVTVSRRTAPIVGKIDQFVNGLSEFVSKSNGIELRNETTSKVVVGGDVSQVYFQHYDDGSSTTFQDDTIWPFWGFDANGDIIFGSGINDGHTITLDSRMVDVEGVGATYKIDVAELRAAKESQESWESLLWFRNDDADTPQYKRAEKIGLIGAANASIKALLSDKSVQDIAKLRASVFLPLTRQQIVNATAAATDNDHHEENIRRLYEYVKSFADEFYGRKFMVRIPFVSSYTEQETNNVVLSQEPTDAGFLEESLWDDAIAINLLPFDVNRLTTQDGRIEAYVKFDNVEELDLSDFSEDDLVLNADGTSVFIKCNVDPNIVFLDRDTLFSPRAIIELPGVVRSLEENGRDYGGILRKLLTDELINNKGATETEAEDVVGSIFGRPGADALKMAQAGLARIPQMAAVPLQSRILTYGPWYGIGADGKVEFEKDDSLVPWNYGGFTVMNLVGNAKVSEAISNQQLSELGSIEIPDVPAINLGSQLISGGPYVTDVNVIIGNEGARTTYRMNTWSPQFGRLGKSNSDRMTRIARTQQQIRRSIRESLRNPPPPKSRIFKARENAIINRAKSTSSHPIILGEVISGPSGNYSSEVVMQPAYNTMTQLNKNYENKAVMSLDGLLRPYSTDPTVSGIAHFQVAESGATSPTVDDLNPFGGRHDIAIVSRGSELPENLHINDSDFEEYEGTNYRAIALKGPLVISGPAYDTDGNFLPSGVDNPWERSDLWPTGPLDLRFDRNRGVYVASSSPSSSGDAKVVKLMSSFTPNSGLVPRVYAATVYDLDFVESGGALVTLNPTEEIIYVANFRSNVPLPNSYHVAHRFNNKWIIDNQSTFLDYQ